jgi:hypothetical protein
VDYKVSLEHNNDSCTDMYMGSMSDGPLDFSRFRTVCNLDRMIPLQNNRNNKSILQDCSKCFGWYDQVIE